MRFYKNILVCVLLTVLLAACSYGSEPADNRDPYEIQVGLIDLGEKLGIGAAPYSRINDSRLIIWNLPGTKVYDLNSMDIVHKTSDDLIPLNNEFYYSSVFNEPLYTTTLYDDSYNPIVSHQSDRRCFVAIDGKTLVFVSKGQTIEVQDTESSETHYFNIQDHYPGHEGVIWSCEFNGETVFFSTTTHPVGERDGIGAYNVLTGEHYLREDLGDLTARIQCYGDNCALWYQDGAAFGTNGTFCVWIDLPNRHSEIIDVGTVSCRFSSSGDYMVAIKDSQSSAGQNQETAEVTIYDTASMKQVYYGKLSVWLLGWPHIDGISISDDSRYITFYATVNKTKETELSPPSLLMLSRQ